MIDFNLILENKKVLLRPMRIEDVDAFAKLSSDPNLWIYFTSDLSVRAELEQWVADGVAQTKAKQRLAFAVVDKETNQLMGSTSLGNISYRDRRIEIGWTWLGRKFQGKGINDTVKRMLMKYCFEELKFERVELKTDVLNISARNALLRIGFKEEGVLRSHTLMTHNRRRDTIYYSLLRSEWNSRQNRE